jgi:glutamate/tyrosine decarboxylase-like PLP-dependent enzyme
MNDRQALLIRAARLAEEYLASVGDRPVVASATGDELRQVLDRPLPARGEDALAVLDRLAAAAARGTVATQGPRFFGFVVGGSYPVATATDWLVSAWDQNAGIFALSPLVSVVEDVTGRWIRNLAGLPDTWSVGFVTGCQMANFTALAAARHHVYRAAGWDVEADGVAGAPPLEVFVSDESHYTIFMALRLLGLGAGRPRRVPTDGQGRMKSAELARMLEGGSGPCIIAAQAGNVNTGAFDPVAEIAELAKARGAWLHVDGAFGFWAASSPRLSGQVAGLAGADSVATDAHKWLNVPYDCGIVLTAHQAAHRSALSLGAAYVVETTTERDPHEFVPEESRRARALPVYAVLATLGRDGLGALVERSCDQARRLAGALVSHPHIRILNDVVLNQVLVEFEAPAGTDASAFNDDVISRIQLDGTCWAGGTTWQGHPAMRVSVSNWSTTDADIDGSAGAIRAAVDAARE